jgi:hypothetical protein
MGSPVMQEEYPETAQRNAVCYSQWDRKAPDLDAWSTAELEYVWFLGAKARTGRPPPGRISSLRMVQPMVGMILGYHRVLMKAWERMWVRLEGIARDDVALGAVGHALVDGQLRDAITPAVTTFLEAAAEHYPKAWDLGQKVAARWTGAIRVSEDVRTTRLREWQEQNARFVTGNLFADVYEGMREILVAPAPAAKAWPRRVLAVFAGKADPPRKTPSLLAWEAAQALAEKQGRRVAGYANPLWGVAHEAFGAELSEAYVITDWITTSEDPCEDCLTLEEEGPYGPGNPLPTVPGAGATRCRQNCMCILEGREAAQGLSGGGPTLNELEETPRSEPAPPTSVEGAPPAADDATRSLRWAQSLDDEQHQALHAWEGAGFAEIRGQDADGRYGGPDSEEARRHAAFLAAVRRAPLVSGPVYRGFANLNLDAAGMLSQPGAVVELQAVSSFTRDPDVALTFSARHNDQPKREFVLWEVVQNKTGRSIDREGSGKRAEQEVIVEKGTQYRVLSRELSRVRVGEGVLRKPYWSRGWRVTVEEIG